MFDIAGNISPKEFIVDDDMFEIFGGGTRKSTTFRGRVVEKGRVRANISWFAYRNSRYTIIKKTTQSDNPLPGGSRIRGKLRLILEQKMRL